MSYLFFIPDHDKASSHKLFDSSSLFCCYEQEMVRKMILQFTVIIKKDLDGNTRETIRMGY